MEWKWLCLRLLLICSCGMIHPDEYFQSQEVMATSVFQLKHTFIPWEWDIEHPNRSILFPIVIAGLPYYLLNYILEKGSWFLSRSALSCLLLVLPRCLLFLLSILVDRSILRIAKKIKVDINISAVVASSWITLLFFTRPFSNTVETFIFTFCIDVFYTVSPHARWWFLGKKRTLLLGGLLSIGIFTRFTFVVFFFPLGLHLVYQEDRIYQNTLLTKRDIHGGAWYERGCHLLKTLLQGFGAFFLVSLICIIMDTAYYYYPNYENASFVIAPWENFKYNMKIDNLAEHGLHPRYTHVVVNMSLLFGPMPLVGVVALLKSARNWSAVHVNLTSCILLPLFLLSLAPHQEARFLLPLFVPLILLVGPRIASSRLLWSLWLVFNILLVFFYGGLHQAGIVPHLITASEARHVFFYRTYMPPRFLSPNRPSDLNHVVEIHDLAGMEWQVVESTLVAALSESNDHIIQLIVPSSILPLKTNLFSYHIEKQVWPHLSTEDWPHNVNTSMSLSILHLEL